MGLCLLVNLDKNGVVLLYEIIRADSIYFEKYEMETVYSWSSNFAVIVLEDNPVNFESANLILLVEMYHTLAIISHTFMKF